MELFTDDGGGYSAVWGSSFDHYGLEVFPGPMTAHLTGSVASVDVSDHPRWSVLAGRKLTGVDIAWSTAGDVRVPDAIRLSTRKTAVWIAAGRPADRPPGDSYHLGTDDVMVVFTAEFAAKVGIPGLRGRSRHGTAVKNS